MRSLSAFLSPERKCCAVEQNGSFAETVCGVLVIKAVVHLRKAANSRRVALSRGIRKGLSIVGRGNETEYTNVFGHCCICMRSCGRRLCRCTATKFSGFTNKQF